MPDLMKRAISVVERNTKLRTNNGNEISELSFAPTKITSDIIDIEDGGWAMIVEIDTTDGGMFVTLYSWDDTMQHDKLCVHRQARGSDDGCAAPAPFVSRDGTTVLFLPCCIISFNPNDARERYSALSDIEWWSTQSAA